MYYRHPLWQAAEDISPPWPHIQYLMFDYGWKANSTLKILFWEAIDYASCPAIVLWGVTWSK